MAPLSLGNSVCFIIVVFLSLFCFVADTLYCKNPGLLLLIDNETLNVYSLTQETREMQGTEAQI